MKRRLYILAMILAIATGAFAQEIRYVKTNGDNSKDGTSWENAKKDIQDAINDLVNNNMTGEVWVAAGTYYPTETTEASSSQYYKAFKIPAGITVRGGFAGSEATASARAVSADNNFGAVGKTGNLDGEEAKSGVYTNKTILCGDLNPSKQASLTWNSTKQQFDVTFYGNSYHVVWFAMNGFSASGRANPLTKPAKLEGCVVEGGHAYTRDAMAEHPHVGYGGGIYMVANSFVYNCEVRNCDASRNGGGIYMDGGGIVRRTLVHDCQALGLGTEFGLGGGICENASALNSKSNPIVVAQSVVTNCVGRMGGGMALLADQAVGKNKYVVVANSTLVNNNTATIEAGGVYTYKGGGLASMTIVKNKCNGSGITQNGQITGRSGGVYSRDASYIGNCVIWGNECEANKHIQYADSRSSLADTEKTKFYYNALSNADIADWSKSEKMGVLSLDDANTTTVANKGNKGYPLFENPTATAGYLADALTGDYDWKVFSESALHHAGINTADLDYEGLTPAPQGTSYDMQFGVFNSRCTMGAIVSEEPSLAPQIDGSNVHFFVDPNYNFATHHGGEEKGASWDLPTRFLGNVLEYIKANATSTLSGKHIYVHVKEGTVDNTDSYKSGRVRTISLDIPSNVTILGSYDEELTGTDLSKRNPVATPTVISGELLDNYKYNIAHLINIEGAENATIDGFQIRYANAYSTELGNANQNGAAITIKRSTEGISFKNITVANCQAAGGAAILADASKASFENCIFHNNETKTITNSGIVYGINGSNLTFDHCDVLRNVGHASYLGGATRNTWKNSIFYGNMRKSMPDTNKDAGGGIDFALPAFSGTTANAKGNHCMFDSKSASFASQFGDNDTGNQWQYNLQYAFVDGTGQGYPRFINPTKNAGVTEDGDATYYGRATSFEPHNNNPIVNMASANGATWGSDLIGVTRNYGGLPDIGAVENHEATEGENAYKDGQKAYGEVLYVRDYRHEDGTIDTSIADRDGTSWARAINGNADYTLSGTTKVFDAQTEEIVFKGYKIHINGTYLDIKNSTLNRVASDSCSLFLLCDANGNPLAESAAPTAAKRLRNALTGEYLYLDYVKNNNTYTFRTSASPANAVATATITASGGGYTIRYTANKTNLYVGDNNSIPQKNSSVWTFAKINETETHGTGTVIDMDYDMGTFKGLQYAVNKANIAYKADLLTSDGDVQKSRKQVWVGAGVYQRDPAKNTGTTPFTPIIDMDTENCFVIQDGVDVYGAFPKTGNPGKDQRQALISQYVNNGTSTFNYADYETILEPITQGIQSGVTRRVLGQYWDYNPKKSGYKTYAGATWDGFTLRNGVMDEKTLIQGDADTNRKNSPGRNGGGGACIYKNVTLKNVVVTNNTTIWSDPGSTQDFRAGGIYIDGGTLDAGYIINNLMEGWSSSSKVPTQSGAAYGGGMYLYSGTVFNSVVANNRIYAAYADGAGIFIENANFFNNTIVNNTAEGTKRACGGVAIWTDASRGTASRLYVYNSIIANNEGIILGKIGNKNLAVQNGGQMELHNCISEDITDIEPTGNNKILFRNCQKVTNYDDIFVANGSYSDRSLNNFKNLNLRLKATAANAINTGDEAPVIGGAVYNLIDYNDMDFAERIQDCNIDIGAYEFNGATSVTPDSISEPGKAIYYVTPDGYGTTNANDPANAACAEKLQRVLDAAGRYKYLNPGKQVIVKVANSYDFLHPTNGTLNPGDDGYIEPTNFTYYATRTTDWTDQDVRVWSIIVPRGVEVWGGYTDVASNNTHASWTNADNGFYARSGSEGAYVYTDRRNITKNPTYFDSYYLNKLEKTDAHTYHVVTFSDRIFDVNGYAYTKNDFEGKTAEQIRAIIQNGTASTYVELPGNDEDLFAHMSDSIDGVSTGVTGNVINIGTAETPQYASNRAVIDGIFVSGGKADASSSNTNTANINQYGGAALVNDYAYVRNCILTGNTAINGGALALTDHALVSGCLIMENEATNKGGGIYVFEEGTKLSDGTTIQSMQKDGDPTMDYNMAHVMTSTIVANKAKQGGGIWYTEDLDANARFNSVAVWQNEAADQANVFGMVNPEQPTEDETLSEIFYPFSFSLIQNMRASGTNNLEAMGLNSQGVRFVNENHDIGQGDNVDQLNIAEEKAESSLHAKLADFGFYGLTKYSTLCSNGMPKSYYKQLQSRIAISDVDILGTDRIDDINNFVEIGARALPKRMPNKQLMLRLFVAHPDVVDTETATRFMRLNGTAGTPEGYYSQMGSSFAYPFNFLQDAIDYITRARNGQIDGLKLSDGTVIDGTVPANKDIVRNLPFEIVLGSGTYYPKQSLNGATESVWAQTFAIPEGVTIIGGFNPQGGGGTYYGRYYKKGTISADATGDIYKYVDPIPSDTRTPGGAEVGRGNKFGSESVTLPAIAASEEHAAQAEKTITFQQWHIQDIADRRAMSDNNKNGIIEPWEFSNQTIISGNAVNGETDGVYHIMTAVADADAVGLMPKAQQTNGAFVGSSIAEETGYQWKEQGQQIRLNGLIVTGGNALTYLSTALDDYGSYMFYHGAGLVVDGNRYKNPDTYGDTSAPEFHNSAAYGLGYRDIPVSITNCQFRNNVAGYGGAISSNGSLSLFASSFEQNKAIGQTETPALGEHWYTNITGTKTEVTEVAYPGHGGAIHCTNQLSAFNTLFANNETCLADGEELTIDLVQHPTFRVPNAAEASATLRAAGGAIMMGSAAQHHIVNCDFVRNKANAYPAVFTMNPTVQQNTTADAVVDTHDYSQIINTVAWGNEVNPEMLAKFPGNTEYQTASKLMVNIGKKNRDQGYVTSKSNRNFYNPAFVEGNVPTNADLSVNNAEATASDSWQEAAWFCAYEEGVGFKPNNTLDLREAIVYSPKKYAPTMITTAAKSIGGNDATYQNCNTLIVADNDDVAGPNFGNPSVKAGFEGFMEGADWSPARFNRLTDNGNGWIRQDVTIDNEKKDFVITFHNDDAGTGNYQGAYPVTHYISTLPGADGVFPEYKLWLALGNEKYMEATNEEVTGLTINNIPLGTRQKNYPRISPDPTLGVTKAYIDIGVYEYQKQPLLKPGNEVDILWVSTKEKPENGPANGLTWKTPTSDLQGAIEALLTSRNGHKKEIRIMEGEYTPVTSQTIEGITGKVNAFVIDTKSLNERVITPSTFEDGHNNDEYYAQSLTIKGGYSSEIMYEYDPVKYKTVIRQKESTDGSNYDHLVYVADPTLRYAYGTTAGYTNNNNGATFGSGDAATAKTMPIQIDGVTLINGKASADTQGSAIYYPNMDTDITGAHSVSVGGKVVYYETKGEMDKLDTDGKTHNGAMVDHETEFALITSEGENIIASPAKIVIAKSHIVGSGNASDNATNASAVYIGQDGGNALIYNTVFHSNYGMPLNAYNTVNINNTFGLNAGKVLLNGEGSEMHNSALWRNNSDGVQVYFGDAAAAGSNKFTYNSYTSASTDDTYHLTSLSNVNSNIGEGPNFVDPENTDIEARSFDIKPSMRLLNKGSLTNASGTYYDKVMHYDLGESKYAAYDYALIPTTGVDVMNRPRFKNEIDLGAYEFQGSLYGILYVDPNKSHRDEATGENWDEAFGYGDLQNAVDLAAIYHATNTDKEAYVFVKGASSTNKNLNTNETLIIRDGVTTYGSIVSSYADWHGIKKADGTTPKYATVDDYIKDMTSIREGIASNAASKTIVTGIKVDGDASLTGGASFPALVDGFVVTNPAPVKESVLNVKNNSTNAVIVLRNIIVADNDLSGAPSGTDVAVINNGLLYEALLRDNKQATDGATLRVSKNTNYAGYAVNVTVEGTTYDANGSKPIDADGNNIYNSITNSINGSGTNVAGAKAPYGNITDNKHISGYFYNIADANLNYQLTETSNYIDMCEVENPLTEVAPNLAPFINYTTDRDILGNPRLISGVTDTDKIDRGAFETWKVENSGNVFLCGDDGTIKDNSNYTGDAYALIKKHYYPHDGSVVYIMEGQSLVIDAVNPEHEVKPTPENPGFLLLKEGANFYGNGRPATCAYVAIERLVRKDGSIVSVPYRMQYNENVSKPMYADGILDELDANVTSAAYEYDNSHRSDWEYIFQADNSNCWSSIGSGLATDANNGVLYEPRPNAFNNDADEYVLLRFTGKGNGLTDYIYTEEGVSKTVTLRQYNNGARDNAGAGNRSTRAAASEGAISIGSNYVDNGNSGDNADFTDVKDMGWNAIGIPYLVSDYKPYETVDAATAQNASSNIYRMNIPHTLWMYYDGKTYSDGTTSANGDGGFYSVSSWDTSDWHLAQNEPATIWVGEGFFTQTATLAADRTEALTFYLPQYSASNVGAKTRLTRYYVADGIDEITEDESIDAELVKTEYYTTDGIRVNKPKQGMIIMREVYSNGTARSRKMYVK